ncbi:hypothetical protein Raf01_21750 [Rugosimonospora africana]|uniref:Uncharacterized protein n=1 Tax=Rugosimonospora africana TaxID=556532 RepID=A0A8J3QR68_9ACTN|nr:hypothetical protein Raf01_21750 [Rugosimonospora africana]
MGSRAPGRRTAIANASRSYCALTTPAVRRAIRSASLANLSREDPANRSKIPMRGTLSDRYHRR